MNMKFSDEVQTGDLDLVVVRLGRLSVDEEKSGLSALFSSAPTIHLYQSSASSHCGLLE